MPTVKSTSQLEKLINTRIQKAVKMTRDYIYEMVHFHLMEYYRDYSPKSYMRTYQLLDSLVKMNVKVSGNMITAEVKIDEDYLNSEYEIGDWTGLQVVKSAEAGLHGGYAVGNGNATFWTNALEELGGESGIKALLIKNLKACGL